jgi:endoglucanase
MTAVARRIALALALIALCVAPADDAAAGDAGPAGQRLSAADFGKPGLRGFNLDLNRLGPADFEALAATGANLVRLMLPVDRCPTCTEYSMRFGPDYLAQVAELARRHRLALVVTVAVFPPDVQSEYWTDPALQASLVDHWRRIARELKGVARWVAYDLVNEPNPPERFYADKVRRWSELAGQLIRAIRAEDPDAAVVVALPGVYWRSAEIMTPLPFENLVYTFHLYDPMALTHQGLKGYPKTERYRPGEVDGTVESATAKVAAFARRHQVPIYVGEFSAVRWAPDDGADRYVERVIALFEAQGWPWTYHAFRGYPGWNPELEPADMQTVLARGKARERAGDTRTMRTLRARFAGNRKLP